MKIDAVKSDKIPPSKMPAAVTATPPAAAAGIGPSTMASAGGASPLGTSAPSTTTAASASPPAVPAVPTATASTSNGSAASANGGGGDDLGPSDEVKVFNNEGEDEREEATERIQAELLEEKSSLITESEKVRNSYFHAFGSSVRIRVGRGRSSLLLAPLSGRRGVVLSTDRRLVSASASVSSSSIDIGSHLRAIVVDVVASRFGQRKKLDS